MKLGAIAKPKSSLPPFLLLLLLSFLFSLSLATDTLTRTQSIRDGQTLVSARGTFELGFFSPVGSTHRHLGIWYKHIPVQTVVWVANRASPLPDRTGHLQLGPAGELLLTNGSNHPIWYTDPVDFSRPVAQLLDSGNFVLRDAADALLVGVAWQTFQCPTDTWLPGMRFSSRLPLGLTSWKNSGDASFGDYTVRLDENGLPQIILWGRSKPVYRTGPWNGLRLSGTPEMKSYSTLFTYAFVSNENETYYEHELNDPSMITRLVLDQAGQLQRFIWANQTQSWVVSWSAPKDLCDRYGSCGPFGVCNMDSNPVCKCVNGFEPRSVGNWTAGCARRTGLRCGSRDGFRRVTELKLPDTATAIVNRSMGLEECKRVCLANCSCVGYTAADISGGVTGCVYWVEDLMDLREFPSGGQDVYVRLAASDLDEDDDEDDETHVPVDKEKLIIIIVATICLSLFFLQLCLRSLWKKKLQGKAKIEQCESHSLLGFGANVAHSSMSTDDVNISAELSLFSLGTIAAATDNFAEESKLGKGGFGEVYKGKLPNGQEVAIKRLSDSSGQGLEEFKNEVILIARLQHMNLVRLLGFYTQGEEKMLIYEYMPNKSLDSILFDPTKGAILDWSKRKRIIDGIAQGLLYLHKYSRLKVIHRDLKASNVLLDAELNPKISDFGIARIFEGNQEQGKTRRVVGTYGYMPPEYALWGHFSEKTDVFSYGVLLLEIISGEKVSGSQGMNGSLNLLNYAWELWEDGRALELVDPQLGNSYCEEELLRCIHVGLSCVQKSAQDRPTMSAVVSQLGGSNVSLPSLNQPAFHAREGQVSGEDCQKRGIGSSNEVTITMMEGR
ncbi:G-type lectin S-receptor-like serine/threonine-protein kinase At4g27290 isoform X2 [Phoenix dactylifera]|uniref:Receptor-like serine/threonine-protein kinase n=1 Tax=Phoenix dactylifera TaxID=42345 RepID=A0A8B7CGX8_PHODC|nr:G-type lectin S-receptor-like serine/threonine-protein kinase At4g27290 isoform X2 [Phoenix dactylifera]